MTEHNQDTSKQSYSKPELKDLGELKELTRTNANPGSDAYSTS